jgi:hypothetical protein
MGLCVGLALGVLSTIPRGPGVTKANFDRIEYGMKKAEVEEIFGNDGVPMLLGGEEVKGERFWDGEDGLGAHITFSNERVDGKFWCPDPEKETILGKIRWRLHLP